MTISTRLSSNVVGVMLDRVWEAIYSGTIDLLRENKPKPEEKVQITDGELCRLFHIMFREVFLNDRFPEPEPTNAPPGTTRKVEVLRSRARSGQSLFSARDADATTATAVNRLNGSGVQMLERELEESAC